MRKSILLNHVSREPWRTVRVTIVSLSLALACSGSSASKGGAAGSSGSSSGAVGADSGSGGSDSGFGGDCADAGNCGAAAMSSFWTPVIPPIMPPVTSGTP